jgi:SAM-dependent methyltransferase
MNAEELERNARLSRRLVHDLNLQPRLEFPRACFDAVICALSVEYLTQPLAVFREAARVLRPGGVFVSVLSERWFPPKVIDLWTRLHPFERLGLVLRYYRDSAVFGELHTESVRGLPRPPQDRYADRLAYSDPIYSVRGQVAG